MTFRPATLMDAGWLYNLRQEDENGAWYGNERTDYGQHVEWLSARIGNPLVLVLIWEIDGEPTGMVRIDSNGEVAFHGGDHLMLEALTVYAPRYGGRLKATVDEGDPKAGLLQRAGFKVSPALFLVNKP